MSGSRTIYPGCNWVRKVENKSKFEDRYTWRHNCVLIVLLETLISQLKVANARPKTEKRHARMVATSILDDLASAQIDKIRLGVVSELVNFSVSP